MAHKAGLSRRMPESRALITHYDTEVHMLWKRCCVSEFFPPTRRNQTTISVFLKDPRSSFQTNFYLHVIDSNPRLVYMTLKSIYLVRQINFWLIPFHFDFNPSGYGGNIIFPVEICTIVWVSCDFTSFFFFFFCKINLKNWFTWI